MTITAPASLIPGSRTIDGELIQNMVTEINGLTGGDGSIEISSAEYSESGSYQPIASDLNVATGASGSFLAGMMGNILGDTMADSGGYEAGVIGAYNITTSNATTNPCGGVIGIVGDLAVGADGAVIAAIDGDGGVTTATAAFKYMMQNSTAGSGVQYGLDLYSPAHDGYLEAAVLNADIRMTHQVCILNGSGAPVDGTTGDNFAGPGSLYIDYANGNAYLQTSLVTTPVWKLVTRAA